MKKTLQKLVLLSFIATLSFFLFRNEACALIILKPLTTISHAGTQVGELLTPKGIAIDPAGNIYVADTGNNRIQKFSADGTVVGQIGGLGSGFQQFDAPFSISASSGLFVWVADYNNHRLLRLDRNLNNAGTLLSDENWPLRYQFQLPVDVAESGQGDLFVADGAQNEIIKFDSFHKPVAVFGGLDIGKFRIQQVGKMAIQGTENVFVSDWLGANVLVFDYFGNFIRLLKEPDFREPMGLALWPSRRCLFVSDAQRGQILAFGTDDGRREPVRILKGGKPFELKRPVGLAFFQQKLFVLDENKSQILVFEVQKVMGPIHR